MLCVAMACLYLGIPTGQVHGGEKTSTVDEVARHAITKLSHIILFFMSRAQLGMDFGIKRGGMKGGGATW